MTYRQEITIRKATEQLEQVRSLLDDVMYRSDPLPSHEHNKIREAYDFICSAIDKL